LLRRLGDGFAGHALVDLPAALWISIRRHPLAAEFHVLVGVSADVWCRWLQTQHFLEGVRQQRGVIDELQRKPFDAT